MSDRRHGASRWARFGGFEIDLPTGELSRQGRTIRLSDKPFQVLVSLLESPGELVTREALQERLWSEDTFVDFDNNLNAAVSRLREALNDSAQTPRYIETIPRKGYRFVGPSPVWDEGPDAPTSAPGRRRWLGLAIAAVGVTVAVSALVVMLRGGGEPVSRAPSSSGRSMLAVLPFEDLSEDPHQEFLADGLTEELLTQLGGVAPERLGVIARTSVRRYKHTDKTIEEIGAELRVDFIVEGSVRVQGEQLRIAAQLIRVSDQTHMWARSYDRDARDLLAIQNDIASQVATAILTHLLPPVAGEAVEVQTEDVEAFKRYLEGLYELAGNDVAASLRAARHFEAAVALDPSYAQAWASLAEARNYIWFGAETPEEARQMSDRAHSAALKALEIDSSLAEAYVALAFARLYHDWDARGAVEALGPALAGSPNSAAARHLAAAAWSALAHHEEALAAAAEALVLDRGSPGSAVALGWYYLFAGRPADAEQSCREALERDPEHAAATECLYQALLRNGKPSEAVRVLGGSLIRQGVASDRFDDVDPENPAEAIAEIERIRLDRLFAERQDDPAAPFDAAISFALLGDIDRALGGLEKAFEERDWRLLYLDVDPRFDALRDDSRFDVLRRRIAPSE